MPQEETTDKSTDAAPIELRQARVPDAASIWRLVRDSGVLDCNSSYLYLLLCRDFSDTCVVAERGEETVGFVTAYRLPRDPSVLFVWQIGVCSTARRQGLAKRMLRDLLDRQDVEQPPRFLEATVAASNIASRRLFQSLAADIGATLVEEEGFLVSDFPAAVSDDPAEAHEAEPRLRIGPLPSA